MKKKKGSDFPFVPTRIKQINMIEIGWRYCYLCFYGEFIVCESKAVGQAIVERLFSDGPEDQIEFVFFDDGRLQLQSELDDCVYEGQNTHYIGIYEPGLACNLKDVSPEITELEQKMQNNGYKKSVDSKKRLGI